MSKGERRRTRVSSTIDRLPDDIRGQLDLKLTDTANTYEELAAWLKEEGYEISKSAIGRYAIRSTQAAQRVAEKLLAVAKNKQVLCVTHLAQIAAQADVHLHVAKAVKGGRTYTTVTPLDHQGRVEEIARIIGGAEITETTRKSAEEMLRR